MNNDININNDHTFQPQLWPKRKYNFYGDLVLFLYGIKRGRKKLVCSPAKS